MRTPCKYAHEITYNRFVNGELKDVAVNECFAVPEPFECDDGCKECCTKYKSLGDNTKLSWIPTQCLDEQYGYIYKCARCGEEIIGTSNYCPRCGYEYEPWYGITFN